MRKVFYYASWTAIIAFLSIVVIGSVAQNGIGPLILAAVMVAAVFGIIHGKED
jgi:hypothetical protein